MIRVDTKAHGLTVATVAMESSDCSESCAVASGSFPKWKWRCPIVAQDIKVELFLFSQALVDGCTFGA